MPGMDGLELIREVNARNLCSHCMILSAYEEFEYAKKALDYRAVGYLVKPIDWTELDARLRELSQDTAQRQRADEILQRYADLYAHAARTDLSPTLKKITRYVQRSYTQDLSLVQLSCQTGFTESYLCTLFTKELKKERKKSRSLFLRFMKTTMEWIITSLVSFSLVTMQSRE